MSVGHGEVALDGIANGSHADLGHGQERRRTPAAYMYLRIGCSRGDSPQTEAGKTTSSSCEDRKCISSNLPSVKGISSRVLSNFSRFRENIQIENGCRRCGGPFRLISTVQCRAQHALPLLDHARPLPFTQFLSCLFVSLECFQLHVRRLIPSVTGRDMPLRRRRLRSISTTLYTVASQRSYLLLTRRKPSKRPRLSHRLRILKVILHPRIMLTAKSLVYI